ncbi:MAG: ABC transporter permease [Pyrinomonadaceae bacterium]
MSVLHSLLEYGIAVKSLTLSSVVLRRWLTQPSARISLLILVALVALTLLMPIVSRSDPHRINLEEKLSGPSWAHLLGTDQYGRDQLVRLASGGRRTLSAALLVLLGTLICSASIGIAVGMIRGLVDAVVMRVVDVMLAFPSLVLALTVVGVLGVGFQNLMLALIVSSCAYYIRLARSYVRLARERQDVIVARLAGVGWLRIVAGHVVPGVLSQLAVIATLDLGGIIIAIAGLSFLGLGVQPPQAEWGAMLSDSRLYFSSAPWLFCRGWPFFCR